MAEGSAAREQLGLLGETIAWPLLLVEILWPLVLALAAAILAVALAYEPSVALSFVSPCLNPLVELAFISVTVRMSSLNSSSSRF